MGEEGTEELAASCSWNSCHHGNREPGLLCEHRKGSNFSGGIRGTSLSGPPASWPEWDWWGGGGHRVTGLPRHPILGATVNWLLPHPSWSSPGREWFQRADAHPAGEEDLGKGASEGRGGFHTGLGAAAILTPACLRSQLKNHQQRICFNPWSPVT